MSTLQRFALVFMKPALKLPDFRGTEPQTCQDEKSQIFMTFIYPFWPFRDGS